MSEDWENDEPDYGLPDFGFALVSSPRRPTARDSAGVLVALRGPAVARQLISLDGFWTAELARLREADTPSAAETAVVAESESTSKWVFKRFGASRGICC
jgi:hypothetical protein